ncbi:isochorismatase domain-containing protein 1 [Salpingoeca rosetta]|uniref:Isochorismatase domain-containing protein 1 n=1 Tax=Salpingoeca rosetta (strain ATCC 50818 / BSB-021) TaxID=946362 RepID=F2U0B6_SALR5|nr:isochorismatase domain-containing protein 1 [Salpingoeca rosetta]EGD80844.1 isochorismatase domain-containing protein 1 [Salpingoeca rosetta]|eukprot:XP_004997405.1 isochorismatase domain-containing protein 1 [Salpingoeca rosetta]
MANRVGKVVADTARFFLCDMQTKFQSTICHFPAILEVNRRLVEASRIMNIPLTVTEQYPKALGATVPELNIPEGLAYPKTKFSMVIDEVVKDMEKEPERNNIVLFGIETHVCILQTALDLLDKGYSVHVVADGVSSRNMVDRMFAIERMRHAGAHITTCESILFQLMGDSRNQHFKEIQKLIMDLSPDSGLLSGR